ncbi:ATP-grasp domain-containing protein [Micromonospora sp. bgisy143]|uniref:ATP-grasp domain-containing protein n=1 Tax=Micromonospora sp. bgisy143 TaxID=3413790 RepID=UPI003EBD113D
MRIGVLAWDHGEEDDDSPVIAELGRERGHDTSLFTVEEIDVAAAPGGGPEVMFNGELGRSFDAVISRAQLHGDWRDRVERLMLASNIPGVAMFDPIEVWQAAYSKFRMMQVLADAGLPVPPTRACRTSADVEAASREWGTVVVKPSYGRAGIDVERITNVADDLPLIETLLARYGVLVCQPYYPTQYGEYRLTVSGDTMPMNMVKYPAVGQWKTRTLLGASFERVEISPELRDISIRATRAMGITLSGLDILPTDDGYVILECNAIPGNLNILGKESQRLAFEAMYEWVEARTPC